MNDKKGLGVPAEDSGRSTAPVGETPNVRLRPDAPALTSAQIQHATLVGLYENLAPLFRTFSSRRGDGAEKLRSEYARELILCGDEMERMTFEVAYDTAILKLKHAIFKAGVEAFKRAMAEAEIQQTDGASDAPKTEHP